MAELRTEQPIIHFVGSIPLPDAETVFRTLAESAGSYLRRLPDGETGIRKTWIRFLQQVLADNPAIEVATDVPPFKFTQWDGKLLREIPRLRVKPGATPDPRRSKPAMPRWRSRPGTYSSNCRKPVSSRRRSNFKSHCRRRLPRPTTTWSPLTGHFCCRR